ncbi:CheY-like chemotaxis protein/HPt (histidine-containing phosphotransfer) domain-containing protein [Luteibacter sp. Sphag1AF]|uniref:response regulator n=1 Tax=Luteibacter sp. Sphag1AF TaxID=2587031 RepID=UPI00160B3821|nr:response regulator [Luteibacter sp. Sphag1AF]MBB3228454.1 CheY-like chemotaxis protein/HPt (histidine-containing phosphotransfer) domain-containing protein [Luteibacter sp. Sphag1AF]
MTPDHTKCSHSPAQAPQTAARILVADDDETTRQFLGEVLNSMGYEVTCCADGRAAAALAATEFYDALILDCRMPHAGAISVLTVLRADAAARSVRSPAIATSADVPPELRAELHAAGFAAVLEKPCQQADLHKLLGNVLGTRAALATLDDREALAATGDAQTMQALRTLLHAELAQLDDDLPDLAHRPRELVERLHRLRSACGFCGASRLGAQARTLHLKVLASAAAPAEDDLAAFRDDLRTTIDALAVPA